MTAIVFLGPSLARSEAETLAPDAAFWPPAQAGDVYRACRQGRAEAIGLIDGVVGTAPAVWHKEILYALSRGVRVLGSSSMGALRAAECAAFGMEGVGEIFDMYATGVLDADDEVIVDHLDEPDGFLATTVSMVQVRKIVDTATERALLEPDEGAAVIAAAREVHYADRTAEQVNALLREHVVEDRASQVIDMAWTDHTDVKAADARLLLTALAAPPAGGEDSPPTTVGEFALEPTVFWQRLRAEVDYPSVPPWFEDTSHPVDLARRVDIGRGALLEPSDDLLGRDRRLFALLVQAECSRLGIHVSGSEVGRKAEEFRRARDLLDVTAMKSWLRNQGLSTEEWYAALAFRVQLDKLAAEHSQDLRRQIPLLVALQGGWEALRHLEGGARHDMDGLSDDEIHAVLADPELPATEDLDELAGLLGFSSASELRAAIERRPRSQHAGTA